MITETRLTHEQLAEKLRTTQDILAEIQQHLARQAPSTPAPLFTKANQAEAAVLALRRALAATTSAQTYAKFHGKDVYFNAA
jgi:hypothetical protein